MPPKRLKQSNDPLESTTTFKIINIKQEVDEYFEIYEENEKTEQEYETEESFEQNLKDNKKQQQKTRKRDRYLKYNKEDLIKAGDLVCSGKLSIFKASKLFSIPKTTLHYFVKNRKLNKLPKKVGIDSRLSDDEEKEILEWLKASSDFGVYKMKSDLVQAAAEILKLNKRPGFKNELPSKAWLTRFISKHSNSVKLRNSHENVDETRFFTMFYKFLTENNLLSVLERPDAFYVIENTIFELSSLTNNSNNRSVLKNALKREGDEHKELNNKESVNVTYCLGANGRKLQELIIFNEDFKDIVKVALIDQELQSKFLFTRTKTGGHTRDSFKCYLQRLDADLKDVQKPIFIFCSETLPQTSLDLYRWCKEREIFIISYIPYEISVLEICNKEIFGIDNFGWRQKIEEISENKKINEMNFIRLLKNINDQIFNKEIIFEVFKLIGIFPFDTSKVDENCEEPEKDISTKMEEKHNVKNLETNYDAMIIKQHLLEMKKSNEKVRNILKSKKIKFQIEFTHDIDKKIDLIESSLKSS